MQTPPHSAMPSCRLEQQNKIINKSTDDKEICLTLQMLQNMYVKEPENSTEEEAQLINLLPDTDIENEGMEHVTVHRFITEYPYLRKTYKCKQS